MTKIDKKIVNSAASLLDSNDNRHNNTWKDDLDMFQDRNIEINEEANQNTLEQLEKHLEK
jgi:hypothetical protein